MSRQKLIAMATLYCSFICRPGFAVEEGTAKPLVVISGANSHVTRASYELLRTPSEMAAAWAKHLGTTVDDAYRPALEVDFSRCRVIANFQGERRNSRGIEFEPLIETASSIKIRFSVLGYQTGGKDNYKPPDRPYAFVVLPKSTKPIVLEENVQQYKGQPPEWKECARLGENKTGK